MSVIRYVFTHYGSDEKIESHMESDNLWEQKPLNEVALGEFSTVMQTLDFVSGLHHCLEFSQPLSCLYQAMQTQEKSFLLLL